MGWIIDITTDKAIDEELLVAVLNDLPGELKVGGTGLQDWGWSMACDVRLKQPQLVRLSGSCGMSGLIAEAFATALVSSLKERGVTATAGPMG